MAEITPWRSRRNNNRHVAHDRHVAHEIAVQTSFCNSIAFYTKQMETITNFAQAGNQIGLHDTAAIYKATLRNSYNPTFDTAVVELLLSQIPNLPPGVRGFDDHRKYALRCLATMGVVRELSFPQMCTPMARFVEDRALSMTKVYLNARFGIVAEPAGGPSLAVNPAAEDQVAPDGKLVLAAQIPIEIERLVEVTPTRKPTTSGGMKTILEEDSASEDPFAS